MFITSSHKAEICKAVEGWKSEGLRVGFVPTMGALHAGHLSLIAQALDNADRIAVSIFVNPTQFAPHEDFDAYPRDITSDLEKLKTAGAHLVYTPDEAGIYPDGRGSSYTPGPAAEGLEGACRPGHFEGVVNVVQRLFDHVQPDIAVFGEKDFQQLQVIREMVEALALPIKIIGAPIMRDDHGLALSSRNAYLSDEELEIARTLNKILYQTSSRWHPAQQSRGDDEENILKNATSQLVTAGFDKVDYVAQRWGRVLAAAWIGKTRLIDNMEI